MRLATEFIRLPVMFDAKKLASEALQFSNSDWEYHPQGYEGNSALILVSANGEQNNDYVGEMKPTSALQQSPYLQQVLASFNTVIGRSRLMRLDPGCSVPPHIDTDYSWQHRVRIHIPIITDPRVNFSSVGNIDIHMHAGECWIFDNWRKHSVENNSDIQRIHLVVDTVGSADFWDLAARGMDPRQTDDTWPDSCVMQSFESDAKPALQFEKHNTSPVRPPDELENMISTITNDLGEYERQSAEQFANFNISATRFCQDWRATWALYADTAEGLPYFESLIREFKSVATPLLGDARLDSNGIEARDVFKRWLAVATDAAALRVRNDAAQSASRPADTSLFDCPVFIVAAPRSGSTMLFETLKENMELWTIGDESHVEIESIRQLNPAARNYDSNALTADDVTPQVGSALVGAFIRKLKNARGALYSQIPAETQSSTIRFLEKTPKNALRIPFLKQLFPGAMFIYLYREAKPNIASIMNAWNSGKFVTYPRLPGWDGSPWSLLLPEGWREQHGRSLAEVAAWQWSVTNNKIMDDLSTLSDSSWCAVSYEELVANPESSLRSLCDFIGVPFGPRMQAIARDGMAHSRYTLTPPAADKWKKHEVDINAAADIFSDAADRLNKLK